MAEVAAMEESQPQAAAPRKTLKRKRQPPAGLESLTLEEKEARIGALRGEIDGLLRYYGEVMGRELGMEGELGGCGSVNGQIAFLMEESDLPLSALVEQIHGRLKERSEGLTAAAVKSGLLLVGQRIMYGVPNPDADVLEDHSSSSLWCWETRDVKLLPKSAQGAIKIRRTCRKKIHERVSAVCEMLSALNKLESDQNYKHDLVKASEKLARVLNEADIRALVDRLTQRNVASMADKDAKRDEKACIKQLEMSKRKAEKEQKKMDRELQKEKLKAEKELKRLQEEAEKEEKRRAKEESVKQLKKQQDEAEKEQRRREKEEAELKKRLSMQKQASIMERFLKKGKTSISPAKENPSTNLASISDNKGDTMLEAATCSMDSVLSSEHEIDDKDLFKSHLSSWRHLGHLIRSNKEQHWSIRRKPKAELIKELKLTTTADKVTVQDEELNIEKLVDGCRERVSEENSCGSPADRSHSDSKRSRRRRQLLQFDKSHRPAFYGIWPKQSNSVRPRDPFRKDPELDYDVDSDEEWEEEDPGESLSDCEKEEDESLEEGCSRADEEDESEDGFFVPDGYLSENEGVEVDRMEIDTAEVRTSSCEQDLESDDFSVLLRRQKYLCSVTEHALRKNQCLIISNLSHEKSAQSNPEDLSGTAKLEIMCLQALCVRVFPGDTSPDISVPSNSDEEQKDCPSSNKDSTTPPISVVAIPDSDLPAIVSTIRSCSQGINKLVESLHQKFPDIPKPHLRSKVRELSDFADNRWQVKKEVLDKLGLSISPDRSGGRTKSIAAFFSKRCLPPAAKAISTERLSSQQSTDSTS